MPQSIEDIARRLFDKPASALGTIEQRVLHRSKNRRTLSEDVNAAFVANQGVGDRIADRIARVGGSWGFILCFVGFLILWALLNTLILSQQDAFDPYPFIFLNLVLSMVAALQAPIIMMSQNREAAKDRLSASKDYEVNLKSEVELISLHHKIDEVLLKEIAKLQADITLLHEKIEIYDRGR